jgi:serine/threonine-protein kinase
LPAFVDPGGKGLRLTASGLPEGLTFSDVGGGKGAIEGVPQQPASASIRVVATNQHDRTAQMTATLVVGDKLAPKSEQVAKLEEPVPEKSPSPRTGGAALLPTQQNVVLAAPSPAVKPETVARVETPPFERPAPAPNENSPLPATPRSTEEKARAFIASFDGGECFLVGPLPGATKPHEYQAVGRAVEPARRFDSAYKRDVGVEAALTMAPITAEQCPALDLIRLAAPDARPAPRLTLQHYEVGLGQPLSGTISNLEQRRPYLVLVDNDGLVHRLETKVDARGDSATFSVPLTADANSVGPMQMLLAIVSDKPVPALDALRSANLKSIVSRLVEDARGASAAVGADYFKFVN